MLHRQLVENDESAMNTFLAVKEEGQFKKIEEERTDKQAKGLM